jgi:DNA polymerase III epsilon subunit family exonuclease
MSVLAGTGGSLPALATDPTDRPGTVRARREVPTPEAYVVFDCETTGTDSAGDEIVSLAVLRLDRDGAETARQTWLVRPSRPIPAEATAVHGIANEDVADAPLFAEIAVEVLGRLEGAVFVAHNVGFDLPMLQHAFARAGVDYRPTSVACTLEAFRLLEPLAANHRLQSICGRHGVALQGAHEAISDVLATAALLRLLLDDGFAPETVGLDYEAYHRLRSRGDTRPASEPQIRRVFGLARSAGLLRPDGGVDRDSVVALVGHATGTADVDSLTRAQVQDVYDALDALITQREALTPAASA